LRAAIDEIESSGVESEHFCEAVHNVTVCYQPSRPREINYREAFAQVALKKGDRENRDLPTGTERIRRGGDKKEKCLGENYRGCRCGILSRKVNRKEEVDVPEQREKKIPLVSLPDHKRSWKRRENLGKEGGYYSIVLFWGYLA